MLELTTFLFANPSFAEGVARVIDFGDTLTEYNRSESGILADLRALRMDSLAAELDLRTAFEVLSREQQTIAAAEEAPAGIRPKK